MIKKLAHMTYKVARRIVIAVVGVTVVIIGAIMLVTPGPGIVGILLGLGILSVEFAWARHWLKKLRESISNRNSVNRAERADAHREQAMDEESGKKTAPES